MKFIGYLSATNLKAIVAQLEQLGAARTGTKDSIGVSMTKKDGSIVSVLSAIKIGREWRVMAQENVLIPANK